MIEYTSSRLCFKADLIEPLKDHDSFVIHTPDGTFMFTKADFYRVFSNVVKTKSYQEGRIYHYPRLPQKANLSLSKTSSKGYAVFNRRPI